MRSGATLFIFPNSLNYFFDIFFHTGKKNFNILLNISFTQNNRQIVKKIYIYKKLFLYLKEGLQWVSQRIWFAKFNHYNIEH